MVDVSVALLLRLFALANLLLDARHSTTSVAVYASPLHRRAGGLPQVDESHRLLCLKDVVVLRELVVQEGDVSLAIVVPLVQTVLAGLEHGVVAVHELLCLGNEVRLSQLAVGVGAPAERAHLLKAYTALHIDNAIVDAAFVQEVAGQELAVPTGGPEWLRFLHSFLRPLLLDLVGVGISVHPVLVSLLSNQLQLGRQANHVLVLWLLEGEVVLMSHEASVALVHLEFTDAGA